jgi:molecular chaperone GrpE
MIKKKAAQPDSEMPMKNISEDEIQDNIEEQKWQKSTEDTGPVELKSEYEVLQDELAELKDKYLRLSAEFDNYRKRTLREKTELIQTAGESLLKELLSTVDDFERGLNAIDRSNDLNAVKEGMHLIYNKLIDFLSINGVKEIPAMDEVFDADRFEAITQIPAPSKDKKGKIIDVIQKGYILHDKIMRYPKVVVGE